MKRHQVAIWDQRPEPCRRPLEGEHLMIHRLERKKRAVLRHPLMLAALLGSVLVVAFAISGSAVATTATCTNAATLAGSAFEIDTDANLVVNTSTCIDWLKNDASQHDADRRLDEARQADRIGRRRVRPGHGRERRQPDDRRGSIPPNKSDLKVFGLYQPRNDRQPEREVPRAVLVACPEPVRHDEHGLRAEPEVLRPAATPTNCANNGRSTVTRRRRCARSATS